jgi:hypothetical protein
MSLALRSGPTSGGAWRTPASFCKEMVTSAPVRWRAAPAHPRGVQPPRVPPRPLPGLVGPLYENNLYDNVHPPGRPGSRRVRPAQGHAGLLQPRLPAGQLLGHAHLGRQARPLQAERPGRRQRLPDPDRERGDPPGPGAALARQPVGHQQGADRPHRGRPGRRGAPRRGRHRGRQGPHPAGQPGHDRLGEARLPGERRRLRDRRAAPGPALRPPHRGARPAAVGRVPGAGHPRRRHDLLRDLPRGRDLPLERRLGQSTRSGTASSPWSSSRT